MLTEPILSHESEYPFPVVHTVLKLAGQGTSDSADSRARLVLYEPAHSGSITHLVDTIDRHHIGTESCPEISIGNRNNMDSPQLKEEYPLKHILNNNRFLSNEMCSNSTFSDNIVNCNLNKSIDKNYLSNNINTNVTFDNEIKTTYTINNSTNRARGQYLVSNNETPGLEAASCFQTDNQNIIDFNRVSKRNDINLLSDDFSGTKFDISQTNAKNFTHNENNCPFRNDILSNVSQNDRTNKTDVNENICENVNDHNINNDMKDDIGNLICNEHCATEDNQNQVINKTGSVGQFSRSHKIKVVDDQYNQRIYNEGKDKELVNLVSTLEKSSENHDKTVSNDDNTTTNKCVDKTPEQSIDTLVNNDDIKTPFELEPSKKNKHEESSINSNMKLVNQSIGMEGNKSIGGTNYSYIRQTTEPAILTKSQSMKNIGASSVHKNEINKPSSPQESCRNFYDKGYSDSKNNVHVRHDKFLNTLKQLKEKQLRASEQSLLENSLARERSKHYRDTYKRRLNKVTSEDDERPLHTINYAHGEFEDGYLSGYKNDMNFSRDGTRISPGCASTGKQYPGSRGSLRRSAKSSSIRNDGKENLSNFDVYNIETAMPYIDLEAIENHLIAATKEERRTWEQFPFTRNVQGH
ncbi:hypothetical protein M8J77_010858 [Diaphorina citri]|nr:hypothetical protein M8J77_010858 [Diaphorina citri]